MVIDCRPQVFKLAARRGIRRALGGVPPADVTVDLGQRLAAEERQKGPGALRRFLGPRSRRRHVPQIAGEDIGYWDLIGITGALRHFEPLASDVFDEQLLSPSTIVNAAASAFPVSAIVLNDPDGRVGDGPRGIPPGPSEQKAWSLGGCRHSSLIRSISASVV
jgi:hypothetical protein